MGVRVVIDNATLRRHRSCRAVYTSPEWDVGLQSLVYSDWDKTVERHIAMGQDGLDRLEWLVNHKLVPMTADELNSIKKARGFSK
jgi:hypothetical protein